MFSLSYRWSQAPSFLVVWRCSLLLCVVWSWDFWFLTCNCSVLTGQTQIPHSKFLISRIFIRIPSLIIFLFFISILLVLHYFWFISIYFNFNLRFFFSYFCSSSIPLPFISFSQPLTLQSNHHKLSQTHNTINLPQLFVQFT